ncbi:MAG: hypothetical protein HND48_15900 [Chloroflexi bacterium]|nr:hypothetical protein [Chloroflexota bacterium]
MFTYALNSLGLFSVNKRVLVIVFTAVLLTIALMAISQHRLRWPGHLAQRLRHIAPANPRPR